MKKIDVAIIGAGPAGMAVTIKLFELGIKNILIFERNNQLGGILNQCVHTGFGLEYFKKDLTGPEYSEKMKNKFLKLKIPYRLNTMVIGLNKDRVLTVTSKEFGLEEYSAKAIILATGCRERTRENLEIPGTRPAGIFNAGQAQELINRKNFKIGNKVIIQGSGDIGLIMARRLIIEGYEVLKVFERLPYLAGLIRNKVQCLDDFNIPIEFNTQISEIIGKDRVSGVYVDRFKEDFLPIKDTNRFYQCDTVLFSVGLIPEIELVKMAGVGAKNNFNPDVNSKFESSIKGIFICGNSLHIHDLVDSASKEAEIIAEYVYQYLNDNYNFRKNINEELPYNIIEQDTKYNELFFNSLNDKIVCIVCPKGCLVNDKEYQCNKGKEFYENRKKIKKQRITTTIFCNYNKEKKRIPIISEEEVETTKINKIKFELKKVKKLETKKFFIECENKKIYFRTV